MQEDMVTCSSCDGEGRNFSPFIYTTEGCRAGFIQCSLCSGTGRITQEQISWVAEGDRMRDDRLERRMSLRAEAASLGISPQELSKMEFGRINPFHEDVKE